MILAHVPFSLGDTHYTELCLVPGDKDQFASAFRVRLLRPTASGVYYISLKEAVSVIQGEEKGSIIIDPIKPSSIYLTPDTATQPGFRIGRLKLIVNATGEDYNVFYMPSDMRGSWRQWEANRQRTE